jgi:hypothetical protein
MSLVYLHDKGVTSRPAPRDISVCGPVVTYQGPSLSLQSLPEPPEVCGGPVGLLKFLMNVSDRLNVDGQTDGQEGF